MPGHAPHPPRRRVMHAAAKQKTIIGILARIGSAFLVECCRRDTRHNAGAPGPCRTGARFWPGSPANRSPAQRMWTACFGRRKIAGVCHAKRSKHIALNIVVFGLAAEFLQQRTQQNEVDVGVAENLAGSRLQGRTQRTMNAFCFVGSPQSPRILQADIDCFAGRLGQQHANRHPGALGIVGRVEVGQIRLHGIVECNLALFVQLHDGSGRCQALRQRRQVEDRVLAHRLCGCGRSVQPGFAGKLARAVRLVEDDLAGMPDHHHRTRKPLCRNRIVDQRGDCRELRCGSRIGGLRRR